MPSFWKDLPRIIDKAATKREAKQTERSVYRQVDDRDHRICRCCRLKTDIEHHHRVSRGAGGATTTANCLSLCKLCHRLAQTYRIFIEGDSCDGPLVFAMSPVVAAHVFTARHLPVPTHIRIDVLDRD